MFKWKISFYERKKEIITKTLTLHNRIIHIKKKERFKLWIFKKRDLVKGVHSKKKKRAFSTQDAGRKMAFP